MTAEIFLSLLTLCSVMSSLLTEAIKTGFGQHNKIPWNVVVLATSMVTGIVTMTIYYNVAGVPFNLTHLAYVLLMGIANWVCAMVGYDKVKQALEQLKA